MEGHPHELLNRTTHKGLVRENYGNSNRSHEAASQDKRLELKLGPPGDNQPLHHHISLKSHSNSNRYITALGSKREFLDTIFEVETKERNWLTNSEGLKSDIQEKKAYAITPTNINAPNSTAKKRFLKICLLLLVE